MVIVLVLWDVAKGLEAKEVALALVIESGWLAVVVTVDSFDIVVAKTVVFAAFVAVPVVVGKNL